MRNSTISAVYRVICGSRMSGYPLRAMMLFKLIDLVLHLITSLFLKPEINISVLLILTEILFSISN